MSARARERGGHGRPRQGRPRQRGLTLVALMVGAMVSFMVIGGVFSGFAFFQAQRRQMTGGDGALQSAISGIADMQRAVKLSGSGLTLYGQLYCPSINIYYDGRGTIADAASLAPVSIVDGGGGSDRLTIAYSSSLFGVMPNRLIDAMPAPSSILQANTGVGLSVNDLVVVGLPGSTLPCTLMQVTHLADTGYGTNIQHNPGASAPWNPPNPVHVFTNAPSYPEGSVIARIGTLNWARYQVTSGRLEVVDLMARTTSVLAEHVVGLKAWYGTNDGTNRNIEQWVAATGAWATPSALQIASIRAVRLGVVLRNPEHVKSTADDGTCNATTTQSLTLWTNGPTFDLATLGTDWACFRYRVLTVVAPMRNVIYGDST